MPASFKILRWKERRDCPVSSKSVRSQTHCSPSLKRSMICNRVSSPKAWNQRAVCASVSSRRGKYALTTADDMGDMYQDFLICQEALHFKKKANIACHIDP